MSVNEELKISRLEARISGLEYYLNKKENEIRELKLLLEEKENEIRELKLSFSFENDALEARLKKAERVYEDAEYALLHTCLYYIYRDNPNKRAYYLKELAKKYLEGEKEVTNE